MSFEPPTVAHAQAGDSVQGGLHAARPRGFVGPMWCIQPKVDTAGEQARPALIIILYVYNRNDSAQCGRGLKYPLNYRLPLFIARVSLAPVNDLKRSGMCLDGSNPLQDKSLYQS